MILSEFGFENFREYARRGSAALALGPFNVSIRTDIDSCLESLFELYRHNEVVSDGFIDVFMAAMSRMRPGQPWRRRAFIYIDGQFDVAMAPERLATPALEWSLNLAIATRAHEYLLLHGAALEKNGRALIMPAPPGSGKSTLAAELCLRGWRLFSDEFCLVQPETGRVRPFPRPISLKNRSIDILRDKAPARVASQVFDGTAKGRVGYFLPDAQSIARQREPAPPALIVLPQWRENGECRIDPLAQTDAYGLLVTNAINADFHGVEGFRLLVGAARRTSAYKISYGQSEDAVSAVESLAANEANCEADR
ncbi:MAG: HprK-related kinase A [Parvularculaceae bacterium]